MEGFLDTLRFVILQIENDLSLAVVDDALAETPLIQIEKIVKVLAGADRGPSKAADGFENLQYEIAGQPGARGACARKELPAFINKNGLFLGPVGFCAIPNEIKSHEHPHSQQITGKRGNVQYGVLIIQPYIGLLVKGAGRAIYQAIENMGHASGFRGSPQNLIQVTQHRHLPVAVRIGRVFQ